MKFKNYLIAAISFLMIATSCVKIDDTFDNRIPTNPKGEYAIVFSNSNNRNTKAVVNSISGTGYDSFSLFSWNSINDTIMKPYLVEADNEASYKYDVIPNQELKYFKKVANWYDFIGVIPTNKTMTLTDGNVKVEGLTSFIVDDKKVEQAVNLTDTLYWKTGLAVDSPEEFLWAYKRVSKEDYGNTVELPFNHGNALVFIGFSSDKTDTKIIDYAPGTPEVPAVPEVRDTTDTWVNLKRGSNVDGSASRTATKTGDTWGSYVDNFEIPAALVAEIKSYYSINGGDPGDYDLHMGNTAWPSAEIRTLRVVKNIPAAYKITYEIPNVGTIDMFNTLKYLEDNGYKMTYKISGGKPDIFTYPIIDMFVNGSSYTVVGFNFGVSTIYSAAAAGNIPSVEYTINVTPGQPAQPGKPALEGVRLFTADSLGLNNVPVDTLYCVHVPHTTTADATISSAGCSLSNREVSKEAIVFSLPWKSTILSSTPNWSATTFYSLPGDENLNFLVVKLSYTYDGVTTYDVRVPIKLPDGGLIPGKYYKYDIYITSTGNGTNNPDEARDEKDEILIEDNPVISVKLIDAGYTQGDERRITI